MSDKLIIFGDSNSFITNILLAKTILLLKHRSDIKLLGIVDTAKHYKPKKITKFLITEIIKKMFNANYCIKLKYLNILCSDLYKICMKENLNIIAKQTDINSPDFIKILRGLNPTIGLAIGCPQIFKKNTISMFDLLVNYHNSLLPKYRGLGATAWSIYFDERTTGYTFHIVNEHIDKGNILISESFDIDYTKDPFHIEIEKTFYAAEKISKLLDLMVERYRGIPQEGEGSYYGNKEMKKYIIIENSEEFTLEEIERRIKSFGLLYINKLPVTKIKKVELCKKNNCYYSKDGFCFIANRISYLPPKLFFIYKKLSGSKYEQ